MPNDLKTVEYMMRVKLPSSAAFHASPSGDTEYETAYRQAVLSALPEGFEVSWGTKNTWPVDNDGMTWVRLYCTDPQSALNYWKVEAVETQKKLTKIKELVGSV